MQSSKLSSSKAVKIVQDTEDVGKAAKEQYYGSGQERVLKVKGSKNYKKVTAGITSSKWTLAPRTNFATRSYGRNCVD